MTDYRPAGKKWSQFSPATTTSGSASLCFIEGGQNRTITLDNFFAQYPDLGEPIVEGDGTPVLQIAGSQYKIRSIESAGGIAVSVGPTNNIQLAVAIENGTSGGAEILVDPDTSPIVARTLQAGSGISVAEAGDVIQIATSATPTPSNTFIINSESDFPTQDATTITLDADTQFVIGASFTTAKSFIVGHQSLITGNNILSPVLTYSGTGSMFTSVDASLTIRNLQIDHPLAQGFDFTDTIGTQILFLNNKVRTVSGTKYGTFDNLQSVLIEGSSALDVDDGVTISGVDNLVTSVDKFFMGSTSASFIGFDFGSSVVQTAELEDLILIGPTGSVGIKGAAASANVPTGVVATVTGCNLSGVDTALDTISVDDIRWFFAGNSGIPDTRKDALISIEGNITETTISSVNTPVKLAGVWTIEGDSHFTSDTTGRITYIGESAFKSPIDFSTTILMAGGGDKQVTIYVAINGSVLTQTGKEGTVSGAKSASITVIWQHTFQTGDYVEIWGENTDNTENIILQQAVGRIN